MTDAAPPPLAENPLSLIEDQLLLGATDGQLVQLVKIKFGIEADDVRALIQDVKDTWGSTPAAQHKERNRRMMLVAIQRAFNAGQPVAAAEIIAMLNRM